MTFAGHQFELSEPQNDGSSLLAHLQAVTEKTGELHPFLANAPALPAGCSGLWGDFLELHGSRGSTGFGAARITFADMDAWQRVRGTALSPWEVDCVRKVDDLWLSDFAPKPKEAK